MKKAEKTKQLILEYAKAEFMKFGFKGASMRTIAAKAGLTTGAIYRYYKDKDALFGAIARPPADELYEKMLEARDMMNNLSSEEKIESMRSYSPDMLAEWLDFMYDHYDAFKLMLCYADGSIYEGYMDKLVELEEEGTKEFIQSLRQSGAAIKEVPADFQHILASAYFSAAFEFVRHDMPKEKACIYIRNLSIFFGAGWNAILGID